MRDRQAPVSEKIQWRDWKLKHPDTLVLSVNGREDAGDGYREYFRSRRGFGGASAEDERLETKTPVFAFHRGAQPYAVAHASIENGTTFVLEDGASVFLFRRSGSSNTFWYNFSLNNPKTLLLE